MSAPRRGGEQDGPVEPEPAGSGDESQEPIDGRMLLVAVAVLGLSVQALGPHVDGAGLSPRRARPRLRA